MGRRGVPQANETETRRDGRVLMGRVQKQSRPRPREQEGHERPGDEGDHAEKESIRLEANGLRWVQGRCGCLTCAPSQATCHPERHAAKDLASTLKPDPSGYLRMTSLRCFTSPH